MARRLGWIMGGGVTIYIYIYMQPPPVPTFLAVLCLLGIYMCRAYACMCVCVPYIHTYIHGRGHVQQSQCCDMVAPSIPYVLEFGNSLNLKLLAFLEFPTFLNPEPYVLDLKQPLARCTGCRAFPKSLPFTPWMPFRECNMDSLDRRPIHVWGKD